MHKKRFLLVTWDGAGNLPPEFALAQELVRRGHEVDVCCQNSMRERAESAGCEFVPFRFVRQWDLTDAEQPEDELAFFMEHCWFAREYVEDLEAMLESVLYDVLLVDSSLVYAMLGALASKVPTIVLHHMLYQYIESGPLPDLFDPELAKISQEFQSQGIGPVTCYRSLLEKAEGVLVFSYADFDKTSADVAHVGPLRTLSTGGLWQRRFTDRPLVLVGLSTSFQAQGPLLQRICDALGKLDVEALVTTGPSISPSSLITPDNVSTVEYVAHDDVLPKADLLITHAGHGTVVAGLSYGVPLLCIPMGRDQPFVAARVAELGLGTVVDQDASQDEIIQRVKSMLDHQSMKSTCSAFAAALETHPGLPRAIEILEGLAT